MSPNISQLFDLTFNTDIDFRLFHMRLCNKMTIKVPALLSHYLRGDINAKICNVELSS